MNSNLPPGVMKRAVARGIGAALAMSMLLFVASLIGYHGMIQQSNSVFVKTFAYTLPLFGSFVMVGAISIGMELATAAVVKKK